MSTRTQTQYYLNRALGSTAVRGLQRLPIGRGAGSWHVWAIQYPTSVYLLGGIAVVSLAFVGVVLWLIFGLQPLDEDEGEGAGAQGAGAQGAAGERKKDR